MEIPEDCLIKFNVGGYYYEVPLETLHKFDSLLKTLAENKDGV